MVSSLIVVFLVRIVFICTVLMLFVFWIICSFFGIIVLLFVLMSEVFKVFMINNIDEEIWSWVVRDILLDIWIVFLAVCIGIFLCCCFIDFFGI